MSFLSSVIALFLKKIGRNLHFLFLQITVHVDTQRKEIVQQIQTETLNKKGLLKCKMSECIQNERKLDSFFLTSHSCSNCII